MGLDSYIYVSDEPLVIDGGAPDEEVQEAGYFRKAHRLDEIITNRYGWFSPHTYVLDKSDIDALRLRLRSFNTLEADRVLGALADAGGKHVYYTRNS